MQAAQLEARTWKQRREGHPAAEPGAVPVSGRVRKRYPVRDNEE